MIPVEIKVVQPSCMGIPLKFTLQSVLFIRLNTTIKAEVEPKFFFPLPDQLTLNGKINVRWESKYIEYSNKDSLVAHPQNWIQLEFGIVVFWEEGRKDSQHCCFSSRSGIEPGSH